MVYIAVFIEYPTPFLREYFDKILNLTYPKERLAILIHNQVRRRTAIFHSMNSFLSGRVPQKSN